MVGIGQVFQERFAGLSGIRSDLGEPYGGFNRLHLAEEGSDIAELVLAPMLQQAGGFGRDLPLMGMRQAAPLLDLLPHGIDHGRMVVLLGRRGQPLAFVEHELLLGVRPCALPGLGNRRDECCAAAALDNLLCRLTLVIKLPVPCRVGIGRVQNRTVKEWICHVQCFSSPRLRTQV